LSAWRIRSPAVSIRKLDDGRALEAAESYKVAGRASVNLQQSIPVRDVFAGHLPLRKDGGAAR